MHYCEDNALIDPQIRSRMVDNGNGLQCHVLEAGDPSRPCILLLHGFPELAFSWRKVMVPLALQGFHVIAPDQRGYGRTAGNDNSYNGDLASFRIFNLVRDALGVVSASGHSQVHAVVGHDFGSPVAAWCAVIRPDVFGSVVLMSAPFAGTPLLFNANSPSNTAAIDHRALLQLHPPRKHYQWYYSTPHANDNMQFCTQGIHDFLRAYYHVKSADWPHNTPYQLNSSSAEQLSNLPEYYVMPANSGMAETVAPHMPDSSVINACEWLTDAELAVYAHEYNRTGFQGGLNWYRCVTSGAYNTELQTFGNMTINVPALFIAGVADWGIYQKPGEYESMQNGACTDFQGSHLVEGAGHWVQQEQPLAVLDVLETFLHSTRVAS